MGEQKHFRLKEPGISDLQGPTERTVFHEQDDDLALDTGLKL